MLLLCRNCISLFFENCWCHKWSSDFFALPVSSPLCYSGVHVTQSLALLCGGLSTIVCLYIIFLQAIVLSVLQFTSSDYPFVIFKRFFFCTWHMLLYRLSLKLKPLKYESHVFFFCVVLVMLDLVNTTTLSTFEKSSHAYLQQDDVGRLNKHETVSRCDCLAKNK